LIKNYRPNSKHDVLCFNEIQRKSDKLIVRAIDFNPNRRK